MNSVIVMVFLVHCTAGVLDCDTIPTDQLRYSSIDDCRGDLAQLLSNKNSMAKGGDVWMGKCVYRMASTDPRRSFRHSVFASGSPALKTIQHTPRAARHDVCASKPGRLQPIAFRVRERPTP